MRGTGILFGLSVAIFCLAAEQSSAAADDGFLGKSLQQWISDLESRTPSVRRGAAFALGKMGTEAFDAIRPLVRALYDPDAGVREAAAYALGEIGPSAGMAADELSKLVTADKDPAVRRSAACALAGLGPANVGSMEPLRKALHDPEAAVRQNAAWAVGQLGHPNKDGESVGLRPGMIGDLAQALGDADPLVRRDAADALGEIGRRAHAAVPSLLKCVRADKDVTVRKTALGALVEVVGPEDRDAAAELLAALRDPDPEIVRGAALVLGTIGGAEAAAAVPALRAALHEPDASSRRPATAVLANIGPLAARAVPELRAVLHDPDPEVRRNAAVALAKIGPKAAEAVPDLVKNLAAQQPDDVRHYAAEAIASAGVVDEQAIPELLRVLREDPVPRVRQRALWALARVEDLQRHGIVPAFESFLSEQDRDMEVVRYEAARLLALRLGPKTPDKAIEVLLEMLRRDNLQIYAGSGAKIRGSATAERDSETTVTRELSGDGRALAAEALGRVGPRLKDRGEIVAALRALASAPDARLRSAVHDALGDIGVGGK